MIDPYRTQQTAKGGVIVPFLTRTHREPCTDDMAAQDIVDIAKRPDTLARLRALLAR
jgi:hypothetical protein